jgi:hypothetical protein
VSIFIQSYVNIKLHVSTLLDTIIHIIQKVRKRGVVRATSACVRDWWKSEHFASFYGFFRSECKYILFLPTMYAYFGILLYCLKIAETTVVLIAFMSVPCHATLYLCCFLPLALRVSGTRRLLFV